MDFDYDQGMWLTRFCFQRALGFVYLIAFLIAANQARPLIGEHGLLGGDPFAGHPPKFIRAQLYEYHFTSGWRARAWWKRAYVGEYPPPLSLENPNFREVLRQQGWQD